MAFNINQMRANLVKGGARPSLFEVRITNPVSTVADIKVPFMVKSAAIPASTIEQINVSYFGRELPFAGNRTFEPWTVTVINDELFDIRNALEQWHNAINLLEQNISSVGAEPSLYLSQGTVTQYSKDGSELRSYQFENIFPTTIASIPLAWENPNAIEEFDVTFVYDTYRVVDSRTGDGGGA